MDEELARRLQFLYSSASHYSSLCPQLAAHLTKRLTTLCSKAGRVLDNSGGKGQSWCPRCSTPFTPSSSHWRTVSAKSLRSKRRDCQRKTREGIDWLSKPLPKHKSYVLVRCLSCHRTFVAGGLNKTSSTTATEVNSQQTHEFTKPAVKLVSSPLAISSTCTPRRYGSTPSNKLKHRRRRSSTLKAQLARSSAVQQQQGQLGVGASPKLNMFLTSVQ